MTVLERVQAGVQLLDNRKPGWSEEIDLNQLSMWNGFRCVLGQLYGEFYPVGINALGLDESQAKDYGFNTYNYMSDDMNTLENEWRRVIANRRSA